MTDTPASSARAAATGAAIEADGLVKRFGTFTAVDRVSLSVGRGEVVALIGPSGSGKSTLLRCLNLLEWPDGGSLAMGDVQLSFDAAASRMASVSLPAWRRRVGMVFQHFNLFPHMTALGNVMEGLTTVLRLPRAEAHARAEAMLAKVGLADRMAHHPSRLSGGQKQRVAIARALAMQPEIMLFDEATSALDPELIGEVLEVIGGLAREGMTMVLVTHEMAFAQEVADRIVMLDQGQIVEQGPPSQILRAPVEPRTQSFLARFRAGHRLPDG